MLPSRFGSGPSSSMRKSRLEGKPSLLPKPRRPGSADRFSIEARRPSTTGHRSSSAEPRGTFGLSHLGREASATKNQRSRSQQAERFGQSSVTPLRSSHYHARPTTTPVRTPSEERSSRGWQTSLDRALAYVTTKDQRPLSNAGWLRAEYTRVQEALTQRSGGPDGNSVALIRPLTIARFVDITGALLSAITRDAKLNTDNYVTKLPHLSKRLLYPGTVSKSWLKTVNTLHAFPHALALIAYLLDLVTHIEMPVLEELLYVEKDELACLRRDYLNKCWVRFQNPVYEFQDLNEEYLQNLKLLLGNDEEKILELQQIIKKYESCLEDEVEAAARAEEARVCELHDCLAAGVRQVTAERRALRVEAARERERAQDLALQVPQLDADIERATVESEQLQRELEEQPLTVAERARLLDEVEYALRVKDSKRALAKQLETMLKNKETELAIWQRKTLDSCMEYKHELIQLSSQQPDLAPLVIDEKELMGAECAATMSRAVETLKGVYAALSAKKAHSTRQREEHARKLALRTEETRAKIEELKSKILRERQAVEEELSSEVAEAAAWSSEQAKISQMLDTLGARQADYSRVEKELEFWEKQDAMWKSKLSSMREYISEQRSEIPRLFEAAQAKRVTILMQAIKTWEAILHDGEKTRIEVS